MAKKTGWCTGVFFYNDQWKKIKAVLKKRRLANDSATPSKVIRDAVDEGIENLK